MAGLSPQVYVPDPPVFFSLCASQRERAHALSISTSFGSLVMGAAWNIY